MKYTRIIAKQSIVLEGTKKPDARALKVLGAYIEQTISADENTVLQVVLDFIEEQHLGSLWSLTVE